MTDTQGNWIPATEEDGNRTAERLAKFVKRTICGLKGHGELMTKREPDRLSLECPDCGWQTPGFDVKPALQFASREPRR